MSTQARAPKAKTKVSSIKVKELAEPKKDISEEAGGEGIHLRIQLLIFLLITAPFLALLSIALYRFFNGDKTRNEFWPAMVIGIILLMIVFGLTVRILLNLLTFTEDAASSDIPVFRILVLYMFTPFAALVFTLSNTSSFACDKVVIGDKA